MLRLKTATAEVSCVTESQQKHIKLRQCEHILCPGASLPLHTKLHTQCWTCQHALLVVAADWCSAKPHTGQSIGTVLYCIVRHEMDCDTHDGQERDMPVEVNTDTDNCRVACGKRVGCASCSDNIQRLQAEARPCCTCKQAAAKGRRRGVLQDVSGKGSWCTGHRAS